ncbi:MAG: DNA sulfur modification protein DndE [Arenicella sp.]|jgi:DNA sulfur modification protein DndE
MFSHIKTSKENKELVTQLTNKLNLGAENVIARIALAYSLAQEEKLDLRDLQDSGGKEYSKSVLFGDQFESYLGMLCTHYSIYKTDKDIPKYIKMHIDDGLQLVNSELEDRPNIEGFDYLVEKLQHLS